MGMADQIAIALSSVRSSYGATATFYRSTNSVEVAVAVGQSEFEHDEVDGFEQELETRDYLVKASDLIISGSVVEPRPGDQIKETINDVVHTWDVVSPFEGEPCFQYQDPGRSSLRIHAKFSGTA